MTAMDMAVMMQRGIGAAYDCDSCMIATTARFVMFSVARGGGFRRRVVGVGDVVVFHCAGCQ